MIHLEQLRKSYNGRCVLDIDDFTFEEGRRYALIGANGSGKSTLLRIIAGTIKPDSGRLDYRLPPHTTMGYMPQKPYIYDFSVLKNVAIACQGAADAEQRAWTALRKMGMDDFAAARGSRLSGGESQRVAFARMLVTPHPLLLLDEPTSAMDINASSRVEEELLAYCQENQTTLIMATHSLAQAQRIAETLILLDHGLIAETGTAQQLIHNPQTAAARQFLHNRIVT